MGDIAPDDGRSAFRRIHLHFRVPYLTRWGQSLVLAGSGSLLGNFDLKKGVALKCHHDKECLMWEVVVSLPWRPEYKYQYAVVRQVDGEMKVDRLETVSRRVTLPERLAEGDMVVVQDTWLDSSYPGSVLATSAFTKVIRAGREERRGVEPPREDPALGEAVVRFATADLMLEEGEGLCVSGGVPQLGCWQQDQLLDLTEVDTPSWEGEVRIPYTAFPFTYKYAVRAPDGTVTVEVGEPRVATLPAAGSSGVGAPAVIVRHDGYYRRDRLWRGAGLAVPVFSLRTHESMGVGEFLDLCKLADFASKCGMRLIQILPVNDTSVYLTWYDSYPYSTVSVHALHPQYLALRALRPSLPQDILDLIEEARQKLNDTQVNYPETMQTKLGLARKVFDRFGQQTLQSAEFEAWFGANSEWLRPYAAFCVLRDLFGTAEHWQWGVLSKPTPELIHRLTCPESELYRKVQFTYYLQYHLHCQLVQASQYAAARRVVLKGDLPIGVDKRSVDTWLAPGLFRMNKSTGAPPDCFDPNGQNWGFPTYNWEEMAKDGYAWWRARLRHMAQYFHVYRIDHVLGFFRIWEIPGDCVTGILGHFRPSNPIWRHELDSRGLGDIERLTEPYVRTHLLEEVFGELTDEVAARYFIESSPGVFKFRSRYSSEADIFAIETRAGSPEWLIQETARIKAGLMQLRHNVVLLQDPEDRNRFYPRFNLMVTSSYRELEPASCREALSSLHEEYFHRRQDELWRRHALSTLPILQEGSEMLVCGEDLGFVPQCVQPVMQELGLIGLRIQRMATEPGQEFNNPAAYPYLTVASPSCHDVSTLRAWYEEDADRRERFFYQMLGCSGAPPETCTPEVVRVVLQQHLNCPSLWAIFPLQDLMAMSDKYTCRPAREEIINDPTKRKHYWRYRIHVSLEQLLQDDELANSLLDMMLASERCRPEDVMDGHLGPDHHQD